MQNEHHRVPVTALAFFKQTITLAGEGTYLHAYDAEFKLLKAISVFESQGIHGIIILEDEPTSTALVWGGCLLRILFLEPKNGDLSIALGGVLNVRDWILDAAFAPSTQPLAAIVTAHNTLLTASIRWPLLSKDEEQDAVLEHQVKGSNCILYSAHLLWLSPSRCLIASGTAFGDIIVWSAVVPNDQSRTQSQMHYNFSGHEGSVFGVRLSSQLNIPGFNGERVLASCSDDRTIRLWDISDLTFENPTLAQVQRDTGFRSRPATEAHTPRCLAKTMGHISRIWHVRFLDGEADDELMRVLSFGEDASVITWILKADDVSYVLSQLGTTRAHSGKNIWCVAVESDSDSLITGGADGAIALRPLYRSHHHITEVPRTLLHQCDSSDNFRAYHFVATDFLVSTTDRGRILLINFSSLGGTFAIREISAPLHGLRGYSFVSGVVPMAFIGGTDGIIYSYTHTSNRLSRLARIDGKIAGLFACKDSFGAVALLITSIGTINAELILIMDSNSESPLIEPSMTLSLNLPTGFITASFVHYVGRKYSYAVLGSRHGSIAIYRYSNDMQLPLPYSKLYPHVHGKDAVTALRWLQEEKFGCELSSWLFSTGRDGTFAAHAVRLSDSQAELQLVHQLTLPFGPNVEGLDITQNGEIWTWGFRSKDFVVYDISAQREVMVVECGGAHRNWAFQANDSGGQFVWTKASKVFRATQSNLPYQLLNSGGHGREIKAVAIATLDSQSLLATGAEDTNIKLFNIRKDGFKCLQTLRKHHTGIQQLKWHESYLFSSGGFEEFFVWKAIPGIPHIMVGVICESMHPNRGRSDLRIMGFDVAGTSSHAGFVITMAYSDSTLKLWHYGDRSWKLFAGADYLTSCLTHAFRVGAGDDDLFTTATDGHIARWMSDREQGALRWVDRYKVHQSAIHEVVHINNIGDGTSIVITGGDDNAIGVTRLEKQNCARTLLIPRAHAAAVTGIAVLSLTEGIYWIASASIDQRVKLWRLEIDVARPGVDGITVRLLHDVFTAVADVSSLELCRLEDGATRLLVCGVGMDLWRPTNTPKGVIAD